MDRAKRAAILVAVSLIVLALSIGSSFLESNSNSENGLIGEAATPDIEEIFASKRLAAQGSGNTTRHSRASSHRAMDQAEGELVRAASALDQAHARLAATSIVVSQAEAAFDFLERRIADLEVHDEDSAAFAKDREERFVLAHEAHKRAGVNREKARRGKAMDQANVRNAEERLHAAERGLRSRQSHE